MPAVSFSLHYRPYHRISYRLWTVGISCASGKWLSVDIYGPFHDFKVGFCRHANVPPASFRRAVIIALAGSYTRLLNVSTSTHDSVSIPASSPAKRHNKEDRTYNLKRQRCPETEEHDHDDSRVEVETREKNMKTS